MIPYITESARLVILVVVALIYALFDVFNKRNVPNLFIYVTIVIGVVVTLTYGYSTAVLSIAIALAVGLLGYFAYRWGVLGGGDIFEFVFVSLMIPIQPVPILTGVSQIALPFLFSVLIAAGYAASIFIPIYYLFLARRRIQTDRRMLLRGLLLFASYLALMALLSLFVRLSLTVVVLILLIAIPSAIILAYERSIYEGMVSMIYPRELEDGDMIAVGLMKQSEVRYFKRITNRFGRLADRSLIQKIKNVRKKIPVYRNSVPFALFIFIGVVVSLLFGNIILYIIS